MEKFLNLFVSGAVTGAIYSLIAAGLALTYSTTGIFFLGYGAVAFTAAFVYFELHSGLGWPIVPAAALTIGVFAPLLGLVLDKLIFRSLTKATESAKIMATVGVLVAIPALAKFVVSLLINDGHFNIPSGDQVFIAPGIGPSPAKVWHLGGVLNFDTNQLIVFAFAAVIALSLWFVLRRTALGLRMRAVVDRPELAQLRGVDRGRTSAVAWTLGMVLAASAGVIGAPIFNSLDPATYTLVMFVATAAVVLGGLRSIPLAYIGGMLVGILQNLVSGYVSLTNEIKGFNSAVPFVLLLVGLAIWGRDRTRRAGSIAEDVPPPDYMAGLPRWRRLAPIVISLVVLFVYMYFLADRFWIGLTTRGLALALVFLSFVVVTGMGGMVSLAQATFVTAAGLAAGLMIDKFHAPFLLALVVGVLVAMFLGIIVALPALRLGGLAFALATLALGYLGDRVLFQWDWFRNFQQGWPIHRPSLWFVHLADDRSLAVVLLIIVLLVTLLIQNLQKSASGRAMTAVRSSEPAAQTSGISPSVIKLTLFALSAALAGLGGILLVTYDQHATNASYTTELGLVWLATVVLWGVRRPAGAIIAGLSSALFPSLLSGGFHWPTYIPTFLAWNGTKSIWLPQLLFGLGAIQMAQNPDGILAVMAEGGYRRRQKRLERRTQRELRRAALAAQAPEATAEDAEAVPASPAGTPTPAMVGASTAPSAASPAQPAGAAPDGQATGPAPASALHPDALLELQGITAAYEEITVLFDIDLVLPPGNITALVGANGAGKSTLCKVVSGLMTPVGGHIFLEGADITPLRAHERANRLLLAPESRGIFPSLSVDENLELRLRSVADRNRAYERFPALAERRRIPAGSLSGGEQQMLTMAPLLVHPPQLVIADEPTLGLAPLIVADIMSIFRDLREQGVTLLLVEERARAVLDIADEVALLELGRIVWSGARSSLDDEHLAAIFLGRAQVEDVTAGAPPT
jgi:ABC-type branched-subunit amino acid transport system ATPase component/branched-subunit amino acid ABC-type transport system permease component